MATTTPPPAQSGFASGKDVVKAAKYTQNVNDSIFKNLMTTQQGQARQATAQQNRILSGMANLTARGENRATAAVKGAAKGLTNQFGGDMAGVVAQKLAPAKAQVKAGRLEAAGQQAAASDLAAGNSAAFKSYAAGAQNAMAAAQTGLAQQLKLYNNAIENAQGSAKTILANSGDDGSYVNKVFNQVGKTLDRASFSQNLTAAGYTDPSEQLFMWNIYQNMGRGKDAGAATQASAMTLYGDQLGKHEVNAMTHGVNGTITAYASNRADQMATQGLDSNAIAAEIVKETGMDLAGALVLAQTALASAGMPVVPGTTGTKPGTHAVYPQKWDGTKWVDDTTQPPTQQYDNWKDATAHVRGVPGY